MLCNGSESLPLSWRWPAGTTPLSAGAYDSTSISWDHCKSMYSSFFLSFFLGHTHGVWKFPGQGSNPSHSRNLRHSDNNPRPTPQGQQRQILYPLSQARNQICSSAASQATLGRSLAHFATAGMAPPRPFCPLCLWFCNCFARALYIWWTQSGPLCVANIYLHFETCLLQDLGAFPSLVS